ncbi:hypothetical protein C9I86_02505 [Photobacterium sp. NCIMB 13483]|nr:hypothetical protein C9I86_02505 [Photobacterium sp. NCIMB 13483]
MIPVHSKTYDLKIVQHDISNGFKPDISKWDLQPKCALCLRYVKDVSIYQYDLQRINYKAKHKSALLKIRQNKQDMMQ